jgi:archaellum component FlaC
MTEFQNDQTNGIFERIEKIEEQLKRIADRLERIADALELLASVVQPQIKDRDATINVQAVCREG